MTNGKIYTITNITHMHTMAHMGACTLYNVNDACRCHVTCTRRSLLARFTWLM